MVLIRVELVFFLETLMALLISEISLILLVMMVLVD